MNPTLIRRRLQQQAEELEQLRRENPEACPNARRFTAVVGFVSGETVPVVPAGTGLVCDFCGCEHVLIVEEVIVETHHEIPEVL